MRKYAFVKGGTQLLEYDTDIRRYNLYEFPSYEKLAECFKTVNRAELFHTKDETDLYVLPEALQAYFVSSFKEPPFNPEKQKVMVNGKYQSLTPALAWLWRNHLTGEGCFKVKRITGYKDGNKNIYTADAVGRAVDCGFVFQKGTVYYIPELNQTVALTQKDGGFVLTIGDRMLNETVQYYAEVERVTPEAYKEFKRVYGYDSIVSRGLLFLASKRGREVLREIAEKCAEGEHLFYIAGKLTDVLNDSFIDSGQVLITSYVIEKDGMKFYPFATVLNEGNIAYLGTFRVHKTNLSLSEARKVVNTIFLKTLSSSLSGIPYTYERRKYLEISLTEEAVRMSVEDIAREYAEKHTGRIDPELLADKTFELACERLSPIFSDVEGVVSDRIYSEDFLKDVKDLYIESLADRLEREVRPCDVVTAVKDRLKLPHELAEKYGSAENLAEELKKRAKTGQDPYTYLADDLTASIFLRTAYVTAASELADKGIFKGNGITIVSSGNALEVKKEKGVSYSKNVNKGTELGR
jgi:hypothetical protein